MADFLDKNDYDMFFVLNAYRPETQNLDAVKSYIRKIEYRIIPDKSLDIIYACSGCGCKTSFQNTNRFRVNANLNILLKNG